MTKMNGIDLPNMADDRNLTVDDIFNENFNVKRNKSDLNKYITINNKESTVTSFNNNTIKKAETPQNLKRKSSKSATDSENYTIVDNNKPTEFNITIDKDSNKTIRLELRYPGDDGSTYKVGDDEAVMMNGNINEEIRMDSSDEKTNNDDNHGPEEVEFINGNDDPENGVSLILRSTICNNILTSQLLFQL